MFQFSLDHYLRRIGFEGQAEPTLPCVKQLMRCQLMSVPFENLDIQAGKIVSLNPDDIAEKILYRQRGGYCFEVNGLFAMALQALQVSHFYIAARPMTHHNVKKPKTHMAVVVQINGELWLCDCGYGGYGLREPICIGQLEVEVDQDGEQFMLSQLDEQHMVLKSRVQGHWEAQYAFDLARHDWVDFEPANYYNSTHHDSLFVRKLLVVQCTPNGRKILFGNALKIVENGRLEKLHLTQENRQEILLREFGLVE